jgi:hypothetical protein
MRAALDVIDRYREAFAVLNHEARYLGRRPQYRDVLKAILAPYLLALKDTLERGRAARLMRFDSMASMVEAVHMLCSGWAMGSGLLDKTDKESYWREIAALVEGRLFVPAAAKP